MMLTSGNLSLKPPNKRVARKYVFPLIQAVNAFIKEYKRLLQSKEVPDAVKLQIERTVKGIR